MIMMMMIPILVTVLGIVTDVSDVHLRKASAPNDRVKVRVILMIVVIIKMKVVVVVVEKMTIVVIVTE